MLETLRCPGCTAELTLPASGGISTSMQCPRCQHVFDAQTPSSTAIATQAPRRRPSPESESFTSLPPTPRPRRSIAPVSVWFAAVFILVLAANAALLTIYGYEYMQREGFLPHDPHFQLRDPVNRVAAMAPGVTFLMFVGWSIAAGHSARTLNASGLMSSFTLGVCLVFCLLSPVIGYIHLQHLWKSSDPQATREPEAWRSVPASWIIRALGLLGVVIIASVIFGGVFAGERLNPWLGLLVLASMFGACVLMLFIVYQIGRRQFQRYIHLYEDPP